MSEEFVENCFFLTPTIVNRNFAPPFRRPIRKMNDPIDPRRADINYWHEREGNEMCLYIAVKDSEPQRVVWEEFETAYFYREYFLCPGCKKRVYKLFLLPNGKEFGCRKCHGLRYQLTSFNRNTRHGQLQYRFNRMNKLSLQRMSIQTPIYKGRYTRRFLSFLRMCQRAGLQSVVDDARRLMEAIQTPKQPQGFRQSPRI